MVPATLPADPPRDCPLCPRLVDYRAANAAAHPDWYNAPVPGWGDPAAWLAIVGFSAVIFNFTIVNVFFKGLHAYSGLS